MFYGWWIVACVFMAQLFMVGFMSYTFPFVIVPVRAEFDASATQANLAMTASTVVGLWLPPLIGPLADRWSADPVVPRGELMAWEVDKWRPDDAAVSGRAR